jgi:hypothetical protein
LNPQEPKLETAAHLESILEELKVREPIFHRPEFGTTRADFEAMMDAGFWEVGASGKRYSRDYVLYVLETRPPNPEEASWVTRDFHCREIVQDNYLLTYTLKQGERLTRRATWWRRAPSGWKILYHQGTAVSPD